MIPAVLIGAGILVTLSWADKFAWQRIVRGLVCGVMVLGAVVDSRGDEWSTRGPLWADTVAEARQSCHAAERENVVVPVTPVGVAMNWEANLTCRWLL